MICENKALPFVELKDPSDATFLRFYLDLFYLSCLCVICIHVGTFYWWLDPGY